MRHVNANVCQGTSTLRMQSVRVVSESVKHIKTLKCHNKYKVRKFIKCGFLHYNKIHL